MPPKDDDKIYPLSTLPAARDPFFQSIPISEVQGRLFYFGRSGKHAFYDDERAMIRDRLKEPRLDIPYDVVIDPRYGPPNALAYRIWVAIEKIISDSGGLFDGVLRLSGRDFSRLAGRKGHGKTTAIQIDEAISQLKTAVIYHWSEGSYTDEDTGEEREGLNSRDFSLFVRRTRIYDKENGKLKYIELEVSDYVLKSILRDRLFYCMSWARLEGLPPPAHLFARKLYSHMSWLYSKRQTKKFEYTKSYEAICAAWLADTTPHTQRKEIERKHIAPRIDPLIERGLITSYDVKPKKNADDGFNLHVKPGLAFFEDYHALYSVQLPLDFGAAALRREENNRNAVLRLLEHFSTAWHGKSDDTTFTESEHAFASEMLLGMSLAEAQTFVTWAVAQARSSKWTNMATFNGLKVFRKGWEDERQKQRAQMERNAREEEARQQKERERQYGTFVAQAVAAYRDTLTVDDLDALEASCRSQLELDVDSSERTGKLFARIFEARVRMSVEAELAKRAGVPSLEEWLAGQSENA